MNALAVTIVRFVDDEPQPGIVAGEFTDAAGRRHTIIDKVYIFSADHLDSASGYPRPGLVRCVITARSQDDQGRNLAHITIAKPDGVESTAGLSEFIVFSADVSECPY